MRWARPGLFYQLRLDPGEEVIESVLEFVRRHRLGSGVISGLGAADEVELGFFDPKRKDYRREVFRGNREIVALTGNVARAGCDPACHIHCITSDSRMAVRGGHLYRARVSVTCEIALLPGSRRISRSLDKRTGLMLLQPRFC